jgi:tRNA 2-thiouridine synthesizing protein A
MSNANCKNKKVMSELTAGQVLEVHATDKCSYNDLAAGEKFGGHILVRHEEEHGVFKFWIQKV